MARRKLTESDNTHQPLPGSFRLWMFRGCAHPISVASRVISEAFDKIDGCGWYAVPDGPGESPYLWIEGKYDGREVLLRLLPDASDAVGEGKGWEVWKKP